MGNFGKWLATGFGTGLGGLVGGPIGAIAGNVVGGFIGRSMQRKENRRARQYNSPKSQMKRYIAAGLNPNLVYTQGSPGAYGAPVDYQSGRDYGSQYLQAGLTQVQTDVGEQKIEESKSKQAVNAAQTQVLKANPYLNEKYVTSMVNRITADAAIKAQEAMLKGLPTELDTGDSIIKGSVAWVKMQAELELLEQKYKLGAADLQMKAAIMTGVGFNNDLKQLEVKFMKDGTVSAGALLQFLKLLLLKFAN